MLEGSAGFRVLLLRVEGELCNTRKSFCGTAEQQGSVPKKNTIGACELQKSMVQYIPSPLVWILRNAWQYNSNLVEGSAAATRICSIDNRKGRRCGLTERHTHHGPQQGP